MDDATVKGVERVTLERLKVMAKSAERREGESLAEWHDRHLSENGEAREALPLLLEVADAAKVHAENPCLWSLERLRAALATLEVEA